MLTNLFLERVIASRLFRRARIYATLTSVSAGDGRRGSRAARVRRPRLRGRRSGRRFFFWGGRLVFSGGGIRCVNVYVMFADLLLERNHIPKIPDWPPRGARL